LVWENFCKSRIAIITVVQRVAFARNIVSPLAIPGMTRLVSR